MPNSSAAQSRLFGGASLIGRIAPDNPLTDYSFDAVRGDLIGLRVLGLNGFDPMLTVIGPDGAEFLANGDDPWSPNPRDSQLTFSTAEPGLYTVRVTGERDSTGDYVLQFEQTPAMPAALLPGGQTAEITTGPDTGTARLQFAAAGDCPTTLVIAPGSVAGMQAVVSLLNQNGTVVARLDAGRTEKRLTLAAGSGLYTAEIVPQPGSANGQLNVAVSCASDASACEPPLDADTSSAAAATPGGLLMVQPGGELVSDAALQGEIGQASPLLGYAFAGRAGDEIVVQTTGISLDFRPTLTLLSPTLSAVATAEARPGTFRGSDALLHVVLPEDGRYTALVGSVDNLPGAFLIRLFDTPAVQPESLPATLDTSTAAPGEAEYFTFTALDACPTALDIQTSAGGSLPVALVVRQAGEEATNLLYPSAVIGSTVVVPAASGTYNVLAFWPGADQPQGQVALSVGCQAESAACTGNGAPLLISTPVPAGAPALATATLVTRSGEAVTAVVAVASANVRRGDSTGFGVIRALAAGDQVAILGISNSGSGWFKVLMAQGDEGWMSPQVLSVTGDTSRLPRLIPPQSPPTTVPAANNGGASTPVPGSPAVCGNGWCEGDESVSCCSDCGTCGGSTTPPQTGPVCGNGTCEAGETCSTCASDCGSGAQDPCWSLCTCSDGSIDSAPDCGSCELFVCGIGLVTSCTGPAG